MMRRLRNMLGFVLDVTPERPAKWCSAVKALVYQA